MGFTELFVEVDDFEKNFDHIYAQKCLSNPTFLPKVRLNQGINL
jgi:hypothetical protein